MCEWISDHWYGVTQLSFSHLDFMRTSNNTYITYRFKKTYIQQQNKK